MAAAPKADPPAEFTSPVARNASRKFDTVVRAAVADYNSKYAKATAELEKDLKLAQIDATKRGDLDEALRIRNALDAISHTPAESGDASDPPPTEITGDVYLVGLLERPLNVGDHGVGRGDILGPRYPITVKGKNFPRALGVHADAQGDKGLEYTINGRFKKILGGVAINDMADSEGGSRSPITFRIVGDGKVLWKSTPARTSKDAQEFNVNVTKVKVIQLIINCPGDPHAAQAVWIDPRLR